MKKELELLKMLRDYVADPETQINGLCGTINIMYFFDHLLTETDFTCLKNILRKNLPTESVFYTKEYSIIDRQFIWERGDKKPRLEFLDKLIKEKASQI